MKFSEISPPLSEYPQRAVRSRSQRMKLQEMKQWIEDNPGKFDGIAERLTAIRIIEEELEEYTHPHP